ncbi:sulfotransferase [Stieleria varia]|uniref:Sulfotransferase domain protein n=1 Tax=Stieleria varia TaxID=2528005 RepID=A0A5C6B199_9BACT|nr:sulfotransferase [Stieleria varia]TWU05953.1 hypothetical protein Pla52n_16690 [Stieleria varia]
MLNVVYIYGLGHSGSTLLDLMLSGHDRIVGTGEASMLTSPDYREKRLAERETKKCSCGQTLQECVLWGTVTQTLVSNPETTHVDALGQLAHRFSESVGSNRWLSDSSKNAQGLDAWLELKRRGAIESLKVIHLVRDARSHAASQLVRSERSGIFNAMRALRFWKASVLQQLDALKQHQLPVHSVGYEELCLFSNASTAGICEFLELPYSESMQNPSGAHGHIATGNPMRLDARKSTATTYDHRWFFRRDIQLAYALLPGLENLNRSASYPLSGQNLKQPSFRPPTATHAS